MSNATIVVASSSVDHMYSHLDSGVSSHSICTFQTNTNQIEILLNYVTNDLT